ncbi:MAG TPA: group III truncated hemoglobin [Rhodanobacteraceae bacterium]|nr:group III truncated hemoglobin [Rhodanobacteraceae bacterium]
MNVQRAEAFVRTTSLEPARVAALVDRFYEKVRADPLLGPVFDAVIEDWDEHKRLLTSFWCTIVLRKGEYRGNPMGKHKPLPIRSAHFDRWLALWRETAPQVLDAEGAALMIAYADRIGRGLHLGMGLGDRGTALGLAVHAAPPGPGGTSE